jgi:hypothetical protein
LRESEGFLRARAEESKAQLGSVLKAIGIYKDNNASHISSIYTHILACI